MSSTPQDLPPASVAPPPSACSTAMTPTTTTTTSLSPATKSDSGRRTDTSRPSPSRRRGSGRSTPRQRPLAASASTVRAGGSFREAIQCCREKLIDPGSLSLENSTRNVDECYGWVDGCSKEAKYFKDCISTTQLNSTRQKSSLDSISDLQYLGKGGFGSVVLGEWKGRRVAVKVKTGLGIDQNGKT